MNALRRRVLLATICGAVLLLTGSAVAWAGVVSPGGQPGPDRGRGPAGDTGGPAPRLDLGTVIRAAGR